MIHVAKASARKKYIGPFLDSSVSDTIGVTSSNGGISAPRCKNIIINPKKKKIKNYTQEFLLLNH